MKLISRLIAMLVLAVPLGRLLARNEVNDMARYRTLGHDALLAVLEDQHNGGVAIACVAVFLMIAFSYFVVQGLGNLIERLANYLRTH